MDGSIPSVLSTLFVQSPPSMDVGSWVVVEEDGNIVVGDDGDDSKLTERLQFPLAEITR